MAQADHIAATSPHLMALMAPVQVFHQDWGLNLTIQTPAQRYPQRCSTKRGLWQRFGVSLLAISHGSRRRER